MCTVSDMNVFLTVRAGTCAKWAEAKTNLWFRLEEVPLHSGDAKILWLDEDGEEMPGGFEDPRACGFRIKVPEPQAVRAFSAIAGANLLALYGIRCSYDTILPQLDPDEQRTMARLENPKGKNRNGPPPTEHRPPPLTGAKIEVRSNPSIQASED